MERRRRGPRIARSLAEATAAAAARAPDLGVGEFARGDLEHAAEDGAQVVALERVLALAAVTLEEDLETRAERRGLEAPANALQLVVAEPPRALGDDELPREPEPLEPRLAPGAELAVLLRRALVMDPQPEPLAVLLTAAFATRVRERERARVSESGEGACEGGTRTGAVLRGSGPRARQSCGAI